jgi:hypothetical protein
MEIATVFSYNRHTRGVTRAVSLLVATTVLAATGAQATEAVHTPMVLTAYSNGAGGTSLLKGNYTEALGEIKRYKPNQMIAASAKATNLCVAYTATRQLPEAKAACDAALKQAKYDKLSSSRLSPGTLQENAYVAIAYANRSVVSMLSHDNAAAKMDLERAQSLAPNADFVARNLSAVARVSGANTIAQVQVGVSVK